MMSFKRNYIYAIVNNSEENPCNTTNRMRGFDNRAIHFMPYRDLAAVTSDTDIIHFDRLDKNELLQAVAIHEKVNASLMEHTNVIPMRFGMIVENRKEFFNVLEKAYLQFKTALERVSGKAEFIIETFWQEKDIIERVMKNNSSIMALQEEIASRGRIFGLPSKIRLGKYIYELLKERRKKYANDILDHLKNRFPDFVEGTIKNGVAGGNLPDTRMIMNYSFLVEKTKEPILASLLNELAEKYSAKGGSASGGKDELKFKYIGPMPPYSFVHTNLTVGNFDLIDNARKILGLGETATLPEIKKAYYRLASLHHPDKHEYKKDQILYILEEAENKMRNVTSANEILTTYCKHSLSSLPIINESIYSFRKEDVERSVIMKKHLSR